jgi:hypothetical protein
MPNWRRNYRKLVITTLTLAAFPLLVAACTEVAPATPSDLQPIDLSRTIERLQKVGPQLRREMDAIEKLHPNTASNCSAAYPEKCIPPSPPDLDCEDITQRNFWVLPPDPHKFDPDGNGIGCEG